MSISVMLSRHRGVVVGVIITVILASVGFAAWHIHQSSGGGVDAGAGKAFFTVDDGKTWFAGDIRNIPPFEKDGKPAYQCFVWTSDDGKTEFVSHLQRYTPDAKKRLEEAQAKGVHADPQSLKMIMMSGVEVKAAGNGDDPKNWINERDPRATGIKLPKATVGKQDNIQQVLP